MSGGGPGKKQLRNRLRLPPWLADRGSRYVNTGFKILWALAAAFDAVIEWFVQGAKARMPGFGTPTALSKEVRGIKRGIAESDASFSERLRSWLMRGTEPGALKMKGHPFELLRQLRSYIGEPVKCRVVDNSGNWHSIDEAGTETTDILPGSWNWDGDWPLYWARMWVILYAPSHWLRWTALYEVDPTLWGGFVSGGSNYTLGQTTPFDVAEDVRAICKDWKPQHAVIVNIIIAFDPASFTPGSAEPDGTWGSYTTGDPQEKTRLDTARFWEGVR